MSLFDKIIRDMTGGNSNSNSRSYNNYSSSSRSSSPKSLYQCRYCGMQYRTDDPRFLPHGGTGCRARGTGSNYRPLDHVWEKLG